MDKPVVSIIMPAFNSAKYIRESVNSVIRQTFDNWELIIVNDGSTDDTMNIADGYAASDLRIRLINQENKKLSAARNTGIANASGSWIAFLDADDLWVSDKLEKQLAIAETRPEVGVIFTDGFTFYDDSAKTATPYGTIAGSLSAGTIYKLEYQGNYIPVLSVIVKKKHVDEVGTQDETLNGCEDWDYWLRLAINGVSFYGMDDKLFYYRKHAANMSNDSYLMTLAKATVFVKNFKKELLTRADVSRINSFINITICSFIRLGKIKEALFLNNRMKEASGRIYRNLCSLLMNLFGSRSYYLVRMVFKVNSLLTINSMAK